MPCYRCFVRGENFPGALIDKAHGLAGFFTTRWVDANDERAAEAAVLELLRRDPDLALSSTVSKPIQAKVYVEEFAQVKPRKDHGNGFSWFAMDDSEAALAARQLERSANWA